jgi:hypothetical protein
MRGDFRVAVAIEKSFTERVSLKTGYNGQPLKWIKVTPKDPELDKVTKRKHIAHIVQASEIQSIWPTGEDNEDGTPEYVVIDKASIKNMFAPTSEMRVLQTLPRSSIPFHCTTQNHYFLNVKKTKKNKVRRANPEDEALYALIHAGLLESGEVLLVKYTAMNTEKFAIVYAEIDGLRMTNLIATNYQKNRSDRQRLGSTKAALFKRLTKKTRAEEVDHTVLRDGYGERLEELIDAAVRGERLEAKVVPKLDCIRRLADLEEDSEDEKEVNDDSDSSESEDEPVVRKVKKRTPPKRKKSTKRKKKKVAVPVEPDTSDSDDSSDSE